MLSTLKFYGIITLMSALSENDKYKLRRSGFIEYEIRKLDDAKTPSGDSQNIDLSKPQWKSVMKSRLKYVSELLQAGKTKNQIGNLIKDYYRNPKHSVWDIIQADDTSPVSKRKVQTDSHISRVMLKKDYVKHQFGTGYLSRRTRRKSIPRYLKDAPRLPNL